MPFEPSPSPVALPPALHPNPRLFICHKQDIIVTYGLRLWYEVNLYL